jgi:hypothetical protein
MREKAIPLKQIFKKILTVLYKNSTYFITTCTDSEHTQALYNLKKMSIYIIHDLYCILKKVQLYIYPWRGYSVLGCTASIRLFAKVQGIKYKTLFLGNGLSFIC